jgi:hypothetical protein
MTQELFPILVSSTIAVLVVFAIALFRSAARADATARHQEKAVWGPGHSNYDEERSSADVTRQSPQPPTNERLTPLPLAQTHTNPPARHPWPGRRVVYPPVRRSGLVAHPPKSRTSTL